MSKALLIPQEIFVGDPAELIIPLSKSDISSLKNFHIEEALLVSPIQTPAITISQIMIIERNNQPHLSIHFIPWDSGLIHFPDLASKGIGIKIPDITVSSILEKTQTNTLQEARAPLLSSRTAYFMYGIIAAGIVFVFILLLIIFLLKKYLYFFLQKLPAKRRVRKFKKQIKKLKRELGAKQHLNEVQIKTWYKNFERAFRVYIFSSAFINKEKPASFSALTYPEVNYAVKKNAKKNSEAGAQIAQMLQKLELGRYGNNKGVEHLRLQKELIDAADPLILTLETELEQRTLPHD
ncbi:hypothetical protein HMPREF9554_01963 [Treponema phagedenis F0421]|uniref:hypothetical protein n=1 Tax=Treponema phagedenis TaxID=162 RepID=UPI0001F63D0A|nr:hypothetical protein [Treponema phagedenis]EFW37542.1 hypothetical protein HMPREF9554_01963 [Treponema phagedenis F0421]